MEDKTYGIKTHLVEEFKQFQISRQKAAMASVGNCSLLINAMLMRTSVVASNGMISIDPFPLFQGGLKGFQIPPQRLDLTGYSTVMITLHPALKIILNFDSVDQKIEFIGKLNLAEESPSSDESASAPSSSSTSNASSPPTTDSGFENIQ